MQFRDGHFIDGRLLSFPHDCPGESCAVLNFLEKQWRTEEKAKSRGKLAVSRTVGSSSEHLAETTAQWEAGGRGFSEVYSTDSHSVNRRP